MKFSILYVECERRGLILERDRRNIGGEHIQYSLTKNSPSGEITALCKNLEEVYDEMIALSC